jgi:transcriptional regulator with XRE-family HTH domain
MIDIGEKLRKARKDAGLRMIDVSAKTGISTKTLTGIETGKHKNFQADTLRKLAGLYKKKVIINLEG